MKQLSWAPGGPCCSFCWTHSYLFAKGAYAVRLSWHTAPHPCSPLQTLIHTTNCTFHLLTIHTSPEPFSLFDSPSFLICCPALPLPGMFFFYAFVCFFPQRKNIKLCINTRHWKSPQFRKSSTSQRWRREASAQRFACICRTIRLGNVYLKILSFFPSVLLFLFHSLQNGAFVSERSAIRAPSWPLSNFL